MITAFQSTRYVLTLACLLCAAVPVAAAAGDSFLERNQARLAATQLEQPQWATPLVTVSPKIEQGFRTDFVRQSLPNQQSTWNLGNAKGVQIVPFPRLELRFSPPPFLVHSNPHTEDGFGDVALRAKYRLYSSPSDQRNAIVTAELTATLPTGKNGNGSCCAILAPSLELGKGWRDMAVTVYAGGSLPVTGAETLGRQIVLNEAIQYRASKLVWLETEFNSTLFRGGKNDDKHQTFITPGLVISRIDLRRSKARGGAPPLLTLGAGEQIALTHFNTYNHSPVLTARLRF